MPTFTLKVTLADTWQPLPLSADANEPVARVKARVLAASAIDAASAGDFEVKFGGALVRDESRTLAEIGASDGAALIVLPRRRRAVR